MSEQVPIDQLRNAPFRMKVGSADDSSLITAMISIGDVLYTIKANGIYAIKLADSIDPKRLNPNIPNIQQRILPYGSDSKIVCRTLLTASSLFKKEFLPSTTDCEQALILSLDALKDIAAMHEEMHAFKAAEQKEINSFNSQQQTRESIILPAIDNASGHFKTFAQKADHFANSLFKIVKIFYKNNVGSGGYESLAQLTHTKYGVNDYFAIFAKDIAPKMEYLRNTRNCLEHPNPPTQIAHIQDFSLNADGDVLLPMIEVVYRGKNYPPVPISAFMERSVEGLSLIFETMVAHLCNKHVHSSSGLPINVVELDAERMNRDNKNVRFCYGVKIDEQIHPIG